MTDKKDLHPEDSHCVKEVQLGPPSIDFGELSSWISSSKQSPTGERPARYLGHVIGSTGNNLKYKSRGRWFLEVDGKKSLTRNYNGVTEYKDFEYEHLSRERVQLVNNIRLICELSVIAIRNALPEESLAEDGLWQCNINLYKKSDSKAPLSWHQDDVDSTGPTFLPVSATYILVRRAPPAAVDAGLQVIFPKGDVKPGSPSLVVEDTSRIVKCEGKVLDNGTYIDKPYNNTACPKTLIILTESAYTHGNIHSTATASPN